MTDLKLTQECSPTYLYAIGVPCISIMQRERGAEIKVKERAFSYLFFRTRIPMTSIKSFIPSLLNDDSMEQVNSFHFNYNRNGTKMKGNESKWNKNEI